MLRRDTIYCGIILMYWSCSVYRDIHRGFYRFRRAKLTTTPAVSVLSTLSEKCANMKPFDIICARSSSDHPPSGHTHTFAALSQIESLRRLCGQSVSRTICVISLPFTSDMRAVNEGAKTMVGSLTHPHCSTASRAIVWSRVIFASDITSFCDRSDRKKINLCIPTSTHFWMIYSIFSILFGSAWERVIESGLSVAGYLRDTPLSLRDFFSIETISYSDSEPSPSKRTIWSPGDDLRTRVSWETISGSVRIISIESGLPRKNLCIEPIRGSTYKYRVEAGESRV